MFNIETIKLSKKCGYTASEFAQEMVEYQGKMKCIGSGCYASVYSDKNHNYVYKISEDSAYLEFVKMLSKQPKQNPYFPIIHAARLIKSCNHHGGDEVLVVCMEKLQRFRTESYPQDILTKIVESDYKETARFCKMFGVEKHLANALVLMSKIAHGKDYYVDLHDDNVMLRGKQLVFTDPFAV